MNLYSPVISGSLTVTGSTSFIGNVTMTGTVSATASNATLLDGTGSVGFTTTASFLAVSSSQQQISSSLLAISRSYATTGSNTFTGLQNFSNTCNPNGFNSGASIYTAGGLQVTYDSYFSSSVFVNGNLTVYGTQSVVHVSSSQFNVGTNIITVNTATPAIRYGGLSVFDSGSTGLTGSILWDSELNRWIYANASGSGGGATYGGGMFISGPRNAQGLGCEQGTTSCMLLVGQGGDHLTSSMIYHSTTCTNFYSNALYVSSSGNVGISISCPSNLLHLVGASATPSLRLGSISNGFHWDIGRENATTGDFIFNNANGGATTEKVRITTGGNVGIGTNSPSNPLSVSNSTSVKIYLTGGSNQNGILLEANSCAPQYYMGNGSGLLGGDHGYIILDVAGNRGVLYDNKSSGETSVRANSYQTIYTNGSEKIRITCAGWVGVGISSPSNYGHGGTNNILEVHNSGTSANSQSHLIISSGATSSTGALGSLTFALPNSSAANKRAAIIYSDITANSSSAVYANLVFGTSCGFGATERMRINSCGGVRIGSSTAFNEDIKFNVYGTGVWDGANVGLQNGGTGGKDWIIFSTNNAFGQGGGNLLFYNNSGPTQNALIIYANGNYDFGGSDVSDARLKQCIQNLNYGINEIMQLSPKSYNLKSEDNLQEENQTVLRKRYGFIAQQVQSILPDTITGQETETDYLGLDYNGVLAVAVKAIQEQQCTINALKTCLGIA